MKKLVIIMVLALVVTLTGCGSANTTKGNTTTQPGATPTTQPGATPTTTEKQLKIGFTANNPSADANQAAHYQEMQTYGESKGVEMIMLDPMGDPNTQINQIENLIQMKVDAIIVRATNATAVIPAIKKAFEAGIPVITDTNNIDESGYSYIKGFVGPSDFDQGVAAAETLIDFYKDSAKEVINVLEVAHTPGTTYAKLRAEGFRKGLEGSNITIMDSQTAMGSSEKGQQITENWLLKYAPGEIDGVYVQGTGMGFGVTNAMKAAGRTAEFPVIFVATIGASYDLIKSGELYASVDQPVYEDSDMAIDFCLKILNGETIEFFNYLPVTVTSQKNIDTIERPVW